MALWLCRTMGTVALWMSVGICGKVEQSVGICGLCGVLWSSGSVCEIYVYSVGSVETSYTCQPIEYAFQIIQIKYTIHGLIYYITLPIYM
jgi:hypothetical protein